jgi:simple sugar transport system permease protein
MTHLDSDQQMTAIAQEPGLEGSGRAAAEVAMQQISRQARAMSLLKEAALLPALVLLIIVGAIVSPVFFSVSNFSGIGLQASSLGVITAGEALILLIGGMDLSLGGIYGFAPMLAAWLIVPASAYGAGYELNAYLGILICLLTGAAIGLLNSTLIVKARLNGFIITLGMLILLGGCQNGIVKAETLYALPSAFAYLGSAYWGQVPVSLVATVLIFIGIGMFLRYHRTGRAIYAIGGNAEAARAAGINVDRVKMGAYIAGGVLAALGGMMEAGRVSAVNNNQGYGEGIIFTVFASAVIGGVSLQGGKGNMVGVATGVLLISVVQNILDLANVSNYWVEAIDGLVIIIALVVARIIGGHQSQT